MRDLFVEKGEEAKARQEVLTARWQLWSMLKCVCIMEKGRVSVGSLRADELLQCKCHICI